MGLRRAEVRSVEVEVEIHDGSDSLSEIVDQSNPRQCNFASGWSHGPSSLTTTDFNGLPSATKCTMIRSFLSCIKGRPVAEHAVRGSITWRSLAASTPVCARKMPDRPPPIQEDEFTEAFLKGSGPGGQKIVC
jgi:hypothetical protein